MDDLISRQAAIEEIARWIGYIDEDMVLRIQTGLKKVPSAQLTGRWIEDSGNIACSECHIIWLYRRTAFCPNCGARMDEVEE